jgi:hypothetical protein
MKDIPQLASAILVLAFASVMLIFGQLYKNQPLKFATAPLARLTAAEAVGWTNRLNRLP